MRPLARIVPRLFSDSLWPPPVRRSLRIPKRPSVRASVCLQCSIRSQVRRFAEAPKLPSSTNPAPPQQLNASDPGSNPSEQTPSSKANATTNLAEEIPSDLPSAEEGRRLAVTKRFSHLMDHLQGNIFIASQRINDLTGYSGIEALKERITRLEQKVQDTQEAVRSSRIAYKTTVADRAATQREVTTLLARKDTWTPLDLERFTALYRMDHSNEQAVQEAATRLADAEREAEHAASKLSSSILSRYHEEQIWSDKIRRMSTWGTWGLMGVNVLLFLVFQFGFEPWRRRRLVHGFEEKVREALEQEKLTRGEVVSSIQEVQLDGVIAAGIQELEKEMDGGTNASEPAVDAVVACIQGQSDEKSPSEGEVEIDAAPDTAEMHIPNFLARLRKTEPWAPYILAVEDLFSSRVIQMKKQDITIVALEGAAIGATIVTIFATLLLRPS